MKNTGFRVLVLLMIFLFCLSKTSLSHPHAFIDCRLTLVFDEQGLVGFQQHWLLDEMFTAFLLESFDTDYDEIFSEDEVQTIQQEAFDNLREFGYFTHAEIDGKHYPILEVNAFSAEMNEDGYAIYSFFVPLAVTAETHIHKVLISVFDESYYTDVVLLRDGISFQAPEQIAIRSRIQELPELSYYFEQIVPKGLLFAFQRNP